MHYQPLDSERGRGYLKNRKEAETHHISIKVMATYDYKCDSCGVFEVEQKISEPVLKECPKCLESGKHSAVERLLSAPAFHLKGGGWYKTDYASNGSSAGTAQKSDSASETKDTPKEEKNGEGTHKDEKKSLKTVSDPGKGSGGCGSGCGCK